MNFRFLGWFLLAVFATVWFGTLGLRDLIRTDEGRYASIAREMLASGDFVTPTLNGLLYFYKPPLQYWATAAAYFVFGETEFAARFFVALTSFIAILGTYFTVQRIAVDKTRTRGLHALSFSAAAIHASMLWVYGLGHLNTLDSALASFLHLALCAYLLAQRKGLRAETQKRWQLLAVGFACLAALTKGLVGFVIPVAAIGIYILVARHWALILSFPWVRGAVVVVVLTAPWVMLVSRQNAEFAHFFFWTEHIERYTSTIHKREGPWWTFIPLLLLGALPWTGFAVTLVRKQGYQTVQSAYALTVNSFALLCAWCSFIFIFFSVSSSKLPSYILPLFGGLSLLLAPIVTHASRRMFTLSLAPMLLIGIVLLAALIPGVFDRLESMPTRRAYSLAMVPWIAMAGTTLLVAYLVAAVRNQISQRTSTIALIAASSLAAYSFAFHAHQQISPTQSGATLARAFVVREGHPAETTPFFLLGRFDHTLPFYLRRNFILVETRDEMDFGLKQAPDRFIPTIALWKVRWSLLDTQAYAIVDTRILDQMARENQSLGPYREVARDIHRVIIARK